MKYTKLWMPVEHSDVDLQQLMDHIGPHVRKAHGMYDKHRHKQAPLPDGVIKLPKMYYSHAIDTKAYGYIAVPQSCWQPTGLNVVTLKGLGQVVFAPPSGGRVVRQVRYIAMQSGRWHAACECITEAQEYSRRSLGSLGRLPTEFTLAHLTPAQEQELRNMMLHMDYWQSYFRLSLHGDPVARATGHIESWALRLLETTRIDGRRYPIYTTTISALRRMMLPKYFGIGGVKTLIFEDPEGIDGRTIQLGAAGSVTLEQTPPKGMHVIDVDYDQEVGVFFATFKQSM